MTKIQEWRDQAQHPALSRKPLKPYGQPHGLTKEICLLVFGPIALPSPPETHPLMSRFFLLAAASVLSSPSVHAADPAPTAPAPLLSAAEYDQEAKARIANFTLPKDISASLFADSSQTQNPTAICFDGQGRLYIAEIPRWRAGVQDIRNEPRLLLDDIDNISSADRLDMMVRDQLNRPLSFYEEYADRIVRVTDTDGDGRADQKVVFADGFNDPLDGPGIGLVAGPDNDIYYTNIPHLWHLTDKDHNGEAETRVSLQDGFGVRMSISGHDMHGIIWGPDGKLYWSIGDRGYSFTTKEGRYLHNPYAGAVFRCDPDGSNIEEYYTGLRNPQELAFDKFGNLFTCDNNADAWDKGRLVYILEGGDSGWNHGHQVMLNFRNALKLRTPDYEHPGHKKVPLNAWLTEDLWDINHPERPAFALPPIDTISWGPSGLVYNYGATAMPERYADHFWVCNFGGAKGDLQAFSVKEQGAGFSVSHQEIFMVGLGNTDVEFGPDGRMYLSCFNNSGWYKQDVGNVYALTAKEPSNSQLLDETRLLLAADFSKPSEAALEDQLHHPDLRVRQKSQFELVKRGASAILLAATNSQQPQLARIHGIWGLGQLARKDESLLPNLASLLSDDNAEIRAQAAKVLADSRVPAMGEFLATALADASPRVQAFAAIGVGKCSHPAAITKLFELLAANDNADPFLRHACVQGLWYLNEREIILKENKNPSAAVRLGVLLTLRKLEDPRVKYFLTDTDPFIVDEAIRAINELDLFTALPDLAAHLDLTITAAETAGSPLPTEHRAWLTQTRLINANFRVGGPAEAARLLRYASQKALAPLLREQALLALLEWPNPLPVDATTGRFRPLDPSTRPDISAAIKEHMPAVFATAEGPLLGLATRLALTYKVAAPVDLLLQQIKDEKAASSDRISSLVGLVQQDPAALDPVWLELLASKDQAFLPAVVGQLMIVQPARGLTEAIALSGSKTLALRQAGYRLLGTTSDPQATEFLKTRMTDWKTELPGALLDLLEAAATPQHPSLAPLLAAYETALDASDPLAPFHPALQGGAVEKGRDLFLTHAAGQCSKCHKVGGDGGIAGPELTGIASRHDATYLLESLIAPSVAVMPGYGIALITLKNGESLGGTILSENDTEIHFHVPDPQTSGGFVEQIIPLSEIASRQPPVSAMPPMGALLTKAEIRDLVAFLGSLKEKGEKKGH